MTGERATKKTDDDKYLFCRCWNYCDHFAYQDKQNFHSNRFAVVFTMNGHTILFNPATINDAHRNPILPFPLNLFSSNRMSNLGCAFLSFRSAIKIRARRWCALFFSLSLFLYLSAHILCSLWIADLSELGKRKCTGTWHVFLRQMFVILPI